MHPNPAFEWNSRDELLAFVAQQVFAHIFTASEGGLFVVHAPVLVTGGGRIRFHVSRRNRIAPHLEGRPVLISVSGRDGYHSANWYASENQVPSWHYEAVEIEGEARMLPDDELVELLDGLSEQMETAQSPERPWTRGKMAPGTFEAMTRAIVGFEIDLEEIRGTRKFNQHKSGEDLTASIEGQRNAGREDIAVAIREATRGK
jgi:transcriptional regulator